MRNADRVLTELAGAELSDAEFEAASGNNG